METHLAAVGLGQGFAGDDFQQQHEFQAITEVLVDVLDAGAGFAEVAVAPCRKGLETRIISVTLLGRLFWNMNFTTFWSAHETFVH